MAAADFLRAVVRDQKRGVARGAWSACSAHPLVLRAAMERARGDGHPVLIESTVNQVNQDGGYTGLRPADFAAEVHRIAAAAGFPADDVVLGADHLGPLAWRTRPAADAMASACTLAADSIRAGYLKIHLDASMPLGGDRLADDGGLPLEIAADREAEIAEAAEHAFGRRGKGTPPPAPPLYVIGSEVPAPGGSTTGEPVTPTPASDLAATVDACRRAFRRRGLDAAWDRVIAVVAQPGAEFDDRGVHAYDRRPARALCRCARDLPGLVLEGHSTDYQEPAALRALVEDGVAVLKVGPALTFALRRALFGLEMIEREVLESGAAALSGLAQTLERAMLADPRHWRGHLRGDERELRIARRYGLSDRARYYWSAPPVAAAVRRLMGNLAGVRVPIGLAGQFLGGGEPAAAAAAGDPVAAVVAAVRGALRPYADAVKERPS